MTNSAIAAWKESVARAGGDAASSATCIRQAADLLNLQAKQLTEKDVQITQLKKAATTAQKEHTEVKTAKTQGEKTNEQQKKKLLADIEAARTILTKMSESLTTIKIDTDHIKEGGHVMIVQHHPVAGSQGASLVAGNGNGSWSHSSGTPVAGSGIRQDSGIQEQRFQYFAQHHPQQPWPQQQYQVMNFDPRQQYQQQQRSAGFQMPLEGQQQFMYRFS
jgi:hypothetical protein